MGGVSKARPGPFAQGVDQLRRYVGIRARSYGSCDPVYVACFELCRFCVCGAEPVVNPGFGAGLRTTVLEVCSLRQARLPWS
jgi:hypothetical protein